MMIRDNICGKPVVLADFSRKTYRQVGRRFLFLVEAKEVRHLRELVNNHPHLVASF